MTAPKAKHINNGDCPKCCELFDKYVGFHPHLRKWFKMIQMIERSAHISCAGRGKEDQEAYFNKGTSRAHYGESAHNYNVAIDVFFQENGQASYNTLLFARHIAPYIEIHNMYEQYGFKLEWYGKPTSSFFELPHIEVKGWRKMALQLVE